MSSIIRYFSSKSLRFLLPLALSAITAATYSYRAYAADQWYTGSLVSPSGPLSKQGMFLLEPYMYYSVPSGMIGPHNNNVPMSSPRQQSLPALPFTDMP